MALRRVPCRAPPGCWQGRVIHQGVRHWAVGMSVILEQPTVGQAVQIYSRSAGGWVAGRVESVESDEATILYSLGPTAGVPGKASRKLVDWDDPEQLLLGESTGRTGYAADDVEDPDHGLTMNPLHRRPTDQDDGDAPNGAGGGYRRRRHLPSRRSSRRSPKTAVTSCRCSIG